MPEYISVEAFWSFFIIAAIICSVIEKFFKKLFRSVYKELHADHETGTADNK